MLLGVLLHALATRYYIIKCYRELVIGPYVCQRK